MEDAFSFCVHTLGCYLDFLLLERQFILQISLVVHFFNSQEMPKAFVGLFLVDVYLPLK